MTGPIQNHQSSFSWRVSCFFSSSGHHCSVWRETVLLHGSDCRPVAVVHVHRCGRAAVGTGETRTRTSSILFWKKNGIDANLFWEQTYWEEDEEVDTLHEVCGSKLLPVTLALMQGCHHNHRHGNELSTWKQRDSCLRAQRENKLSVSVPLWIHTCTQTHHYMHDPVNMYAHTHTHRSRKHTLYRRSLVGSVGGQRLRTETERCWQKQIWSLWFILENVSNRESVTGCACLLLQLNNEQKSVQLHK